MPILAKEDIQTPKSQTQTRHKSTAQLTDLRQQVKWKNLHLMLRHAPVDGRPSCVSGDDFSAVDSVAHHRDPQLRHLVDKDLIDTGTAAQVVGRFKKVLGYGCRVCDHDRVTPPVPDRREDRLENDFLDAVPGYEFDDFLRIIRDQGRANRKADCPRNGKLFYFRVGKLS